MARTDRGRPSIPQIDQNIHQLLVFCHHMNSYVIGREIHPPLIGPGQHRARDVPTPSTGGTGRASNMTITAKICPVKPLFSSIYSNRRQPLAWATVIRLIPSWLTMVRLSRRPSDASGAGMRTFADREGTSCARYGADRSQTRQSIQNIHH